MTGWGKLHEGLVVSRGVDVGRVGLKAPAFFYGSYMDPEVLKRFGAHPVAGAPATLTGWRLTFSPHANLVEDGGAEVEGYVYELPHEELEALYGPHGYVTTYRPVPVIVETPSGEQPAMTFIELAKPQSPDPAYLEAFLGICEKVGLPASYVERVRSEAQRLAPTA